jgi:hypothetical protein
VYGHDIAAEQAQERHAMQARFGRYGVDPARGYQLAESI